MIGSAKLCDDATFQELTRALETGASDELMAIDRLLAEHPDDGRLHFLRGSMLVGIGRPIEALPALRKAVELSPDLAIARFQLGFFMLTSGDAGEALSVWGPLALLPDTHYLRTFVGGLTHLIRDEFAECVRLLEGGIAQNDENQPLNRDMQLIVDKVRDLAQPAGTGQDSDISATSVLLGQFTQRPTAH